MIAIIITGICFLICLILFLMQPDNPVILFNTIICLIFFGFNIHMYNNKIKKQKEIPQKEMSISEFKESLEKSGYKLIVVKEKENK